MNDPSRLALAIIPEGIFIEDLQPGEDDRVEPAVRAAYDEGGVLALALRFPSAAVPPSVGYAREVAARFVAGLCRLPSLDSTRGPVQVPPEDTVLAELVERVPPMRGAEYVSVELLHPVWRVLQSRLDGLLKHFKGTVQEFIKQQAPEWNLVGRVCFHLAENKNDPESPFAFLATYTTGLGAGANARHRPLGHALEEYAGAGNKPALVALLTPVQKAAQLSPFLDGIVQTRGIFHPLAWSPEEAHAFLQDVPSYEAAGVMVRVPDWWKKRGARLRVDVAVGERQPSKLGLDALLDFKVSVALDGQRLSAEEWRDALRANSGLVRIKGRWVEVDAEKLKEVLDHWKAVEKHAGRGMSFLEGMRLLAGVSADLEEHAADENIRAWTHVHAGNWLRPLLEGARDPKVLDEIKGDGALKAVLRPYQEDGVRWLHLINSLQLGACLADDMGLGKTVQVLALMLILKKRKISRPHLLVVPASLVGNWLSEMERFAPSLRCQVLHPAAGQTGKVPLKDVDVVMTTYGMAVRTPWLHKQAWDTVVLDEAQAIKNPGTRQARAVKELNGRARIVLTGTPVENRVGDVWSLFDFLNPGLLGNRTVFTRFSRRLADRNDYAPLRHLLRPYILRRLKSDKTIISNLPDKTEVNAYCALSTRQAALYQDTVASLKRALADADGLKRRGVVLQHLMRFKQICNHPSQWLGDGAYNAADSGKYARLAELAEVIADKGEKVLVFTQFQEMTAPLHEHLHGLFGRPGVILDGKTAVKDRKERVARFQEDPQVPFFVISLKAGGVGLNLTAASHVIHFDRWWNPAVENQATDRAYRIGQHRNVLVHKFICRGTLEERIDALIASKRALSEQLLESSGEVPLTELSDDELMRLVALDVEAAEAA